jgi:hypothetical protein
MRGHKRFGNLCRYQIADECVEHYGPTEAAHTLRPITRVCRFLRGPTCSKGLRPWRATSCHAKGNRLSFAGDAAA